MYTIEKNIPAPDSRSKYPFPQMEVGDSFFVPGNEIVGSRVSVAMNYYKKKNPKKSFISRKSADGMRIWRTK